MLCSRTRRVVPNELARIQLLPSELKQHILMLAFAEPRKPITELLGVMGILVINILKNEDVPSRNFTIYALSQGVLRCVEEIRFTSRSMYKLFDHDYAKLMALNFLKQIFQCVDDLEFFLRLNGSLLPNDLTHLKVSYVCANWRPAKIVIYAAPRGKIHTDKDIYNGILHAFNFENDVLHPIGINEHNILRIDYANNIPFLAYRKHDALLSSRDMGVFAAVVAVTKCHVYDNQGDSFRYLAPAGTKREKQTVCISKSPFMPMHLFDVWREWPEEKEE